MKKTIIFLFAILLSFSSYSQLQEIRLTQAEFDAIDTLQSDHQAIEGQVLKEPVYNNDGSISYWLRIEWISEGQNGNWNIEVRKIIVLNRSRNITLGIEVLDNLNNALRTELANETITLANAAALLNRIPAVMLYIELGWLEEARVLLNNMTTDANALTTARKNYILNQIDAAIEKI